MKYFKTSNYLKDNYNDFYKNDESKWRWLGAVNKADNIISICKNLPIKSIVEIGAGEGSLLKRLSEMNFGQELYAFEISSEAIEIIKSKPIPRLKECLLFDGYNIPYNNKQFDLSILSHVVEHVEYPRKLIYEAKRISKYVFIEVPLEDNLRLPVDFISDEVGHINFYSQKTIRRLIQTCNLKVLNQKTVNVSKDVYKFKDGNKGLINYYIKEFLLKISPLIGTGIFTYHSALICQDSYEKDNK